MATIQEQLDERREKARAAGKTAPPSPVIEGLKRRRVNARLEKEIFKLEQDTGTEQKGTILERAGRAVLGNPLISTVLDAVSRPNFAVAGALEEVWSRGGFVAPGVPLNPVAGMAALGRAGREIGSGLPGVQGEKRAFGGVFENLGFGPGPSLSDVGTAITLPFGQRAPIKPGSFFDITARGALGLAFDVALDPTTYASFGTAATGKQGVRAGKFFLTEKGVMRLKNEFGRAVARGLTQAEADTAARLAVEQAIDRGARGLADKGGLKMFGQTLIPGEVFNKPARNVRDAMSKYLQQTSAGRLVLDIGEGTGRAFNRDWRVRKLPDYVARKQLYLTTLDNSQREFRDLLEDVFRGTTKDDRVAITNFIDSAGATEIEPKLMPLVKKTNDLYSQMAVLEQKMGLLDQVRTDYVFHAYDASPKRVKDILARFDPTRLRSTLRGSQKARVFDTLEEARKVLAAQGIKPIEDAYELLLRRGFRHLHAVETRRFFDDVAARWGVRALPDELEAGAAKVASEMNDVEKVVAADIGKGLEDTAKPKRATTGISREEVSAIEKASRRGVPIEEVRALSEAGRKEFLARRFERVQSPWELENVMKKYDEFKDLFPETTSKRTRSLPTFDGEPMATLDLPEFKGMTVPADIAEDIRDFNKHFINRDDVVGIWRAYDKFMNTFKVGVTSIFPAFHFRNGYSNIVQMFTDLGMQALNPRMHAGTIRMLAGDVSGSFVARHGRRWGFSEIVYEAKRRGVLSDYRNIFETFGDKIPIRTGRSKLGNLVLHPVDTWKRFGGVIENEARLTAFSTYLRRGLDPTTAANRVNKVLFDYKNLSRVERDVLARIFPFYRWTRKNIALQAERLIRNPAQAAIQAKLVRQNRTDPSLLPAYLRGDFVFTLEADPQTGKLRYIRGLDLPITDLNIIGEPLQRLIQDMAPLAKVIAEIPLDYDFFRRRKISENSTPLLKGIGPILDLLPQRAKNAIDFSKRRAPDGTMEYRMNPLLAHVLIKSWALSRTYGTAERLLRSKSLASGRNFLDITTGFRLQDVDVDVAMDNLEREYKSALGSEAIAKGTRRWFSRTYVPKPKK